MSRIKEPLQQHIHDEIAAELNRAVINIKIHYRNLDDQTEDQRNKIINLRKMLEAPTWDYMIDLLERTHLEIIQCKQPFKRF